MVSPVKRNAALQPLSREHHHALLLCWKIKYGFAKDISAERIKAYADWFYKNHLAPHFELEETYIYPILGKENALIQQALKEHALLCIHFNDTSDPEKSLKQIQVELEKHIRFEERILFNEIQNAATPTELDRIEKAHSLETFVDNLGDKFWETG